MNRRLASLAAARQPDAMRKPLFVLIAIIALASASLAIVTPVAPMRQDLLGTWIGFTEYGTDFYRVILTNRGGFVASSFAREGPKLYRIDSWEIGPRSRAIIRASPISTNAYHVEMEALVQSGRIQLTVHGSKKESWRMEVPLYREELIAGQISALTTSMAGLQ